MLWIVNKSHQTDTICKDRNSHWSCSVEKGVLRNLAKFTGKHPCQSLLFNKVAGLTPAALLKKRLLQRRCPVDFAKFFRKLLTEHLWWLLLTISKGRIFSLAQLEYSFNTASSIIFNRCYLELNGCKVLNSWISGVLKIYENQLKFVRIRGSVHSWRVTVTE